MSEFRKFCIGFFAAAGAGSAAINYHLVNATADLNSPGGILLLAATSGAIAVIMFGDKK